ncbi:J domain-containing protein [Haloarcula litorea]|uniref:J domain-containing protein n=1 Tax=Haloarcula litorea TaxID=3032579 RepID=UPI0023E8660C|nr:J domain-containing protein [Halomicroarcula sp. GDY20]
MQYDRLIKGVAAVFAVLTAMLTVTGLFGNPAVLVLAAMFAASTYFMYYHVSGKMAADLYDRVERRAAQGGARRDGARRGGFGAGPRDDWEPPGGDQRVGGFAGRARQARRQARETVGGGRQRQRRQRRRSGQRVASSSGPTPSEAYDRLGLDPGADEEAVKRAYRERVKEAHPDTDSGSEREFKRVQAAYERLTDD